MTNYSNEILTALQQFYKALDNHVQELEKKNSSRLNCKKGCFSCCKDDLEVFGIEAAYIQTNESEFLNLLEKVELATILGTWQATLTDLKLKWYYTLPTLA